MMKRLALTIALAGLSGGALAADLRGPIIEAPPPLPVPVAGFSWTGGYAGVNVGIGAGHTDYAYDVNTYNNGYNNGGYNNGYNNGGNSGGSYYDATCDCNVSGNGWGDGGNGGNGNNGGGGTATNYTGSGSGSEKLRQSGVLGGVQVGYNYALGGLGGFGGLGGGGYGGRGGLLGGITPVIGVEADFDGSGISSGGALSEFANGFPYNNGNYVGVHSDIKYFGTVRGRLGVAFDRLLVFGTGGFAYADTDAYVNSASYGITGSRNNFHTGIAYGGGFEFAITNNLLLRAEYLHLDLNRKAIVQGDTGYATYALYEKPSIDLVRAGLSYKFDFARTVAPPVIARY